MIKKNVFLLMCFGLLFSNAFAVTDLLAVYHDAIGFDPKFKEDTATYLAQREARPQAIAALLPNINATGTKTHNVVKNTFGGQNGSQEINIPRTPFRAQNYSINLSQPIFNYSAWMSVSQSNIVVKQAKATLNASAQNLLLRISQAYFAVLDAKDNLHYTRAEKKATARQLDQAEQRYKVGVETITAVYDARARYDAVIAEEITAQNAVQNNLEKLREITGQFYPELARVNEKRLPLVLPTPNKVDLWIEKAKKQNYSLLAASYSMLAAQKNIRISEGNHLPTVNFITNYDNNKSKTLLGLTFDRFHGVTKEAGLQFNLPIFEGGKVLSQTRQASYHYQSRAFERDRVYQNLISITHQAFNNVVSGISQIKADRQAVVSNQSSVDSLEAAYQVGTRTLLDVLTAQRDLYQVQRALSHDMYTYIDSILTLKYAAGTLSPSDIAQINEWLTQETYKEYA